MTCYLTPETEIKRITLSILSNITKIESFKKEKSLILGEQTNLPLIRELYFYKEKCKGEKE